MWPHKNLKTHDNISEVYKHVALKVGGTGAYFDPFDSQAV